MDLGALFFLPFKTSWAEKTQRGTWATQDPPAVSGLGTGMMAS